MSDETHGRSLVMIQMEDLNFYCHGLPKNSIVHQAMTVQFFCTFFSIDMYALERATSYIFFQKNCDNAKVSVNDLFELNV